MLAKRNQQKPLIPPSYIMRNVPRCHNAEDGSKVLVNSQVQEITTREHFADNTAELVLLCNEVMRRQQIGKKDKTTSKPLSLEYIADRMDIDDPIFGYFVRTTAESTAEDGSSVEPGMLQGFVMATTFTNWQTTFRWDSMHDSAFAYDDENLSKQMTSGARKFDKDGSIAAQLQATVRCGDPWNEGIVWPRIAEISLLGGLSCGKVLLELIIEQLESMPATTVRNYDWVALQATKNSVSFYERMGFIRVGAVTKDKLYLKRREARENGSDDELDTNDITLNASSDENVLEDAVDGIVSSPVELYKTKKGGETPLTVAKQFGVDVWDVIFLNHYVHKDIQPKSWLYKGTELFIPSPKSELDGKTNAKFLSRDELEIGKFPKWYIAKENETPRSISKKLKLPCKELIQANSRIDGLAPSIRLKAGTKLQISHFDLSDDMFIPYNHWTFPDDIFENLDPSYMMVRKLNRKTGAEAKLKPVQQKLYKTTKYIHKSPNESAFFFTDSEEDKTVKIRSKKNHLQPKKPMDAFSFFSRDARTRMRNLLDRKTAGETNTIIMSAWKDLEPSSRNQYEEMASKAKHDYDQAIKVISTKGKVSAKKKEIKRSKAPLFNQVVTLNSEGIKYHGDEFPYYYVLTYLPDLEWCHLCPMTQNGVLDNGRPRWNLIDESQGKEIDTSALFCNVVESQGLHGCPDADEEEWDIFEAKPVVGMQELLKLRQKATSGPKLVAKVNGVAITPPHTSQEDVNNSSKKRKAVKASILETLGGGPNQLNITQLIPNLTVPQSPESLNKRQASTPNSCVATGFFSENTPQNNARSRHLMASSLHKPVMILNPTLNGTGSVGQMSNFHLNICRKDVGPGNQVQNSYLNTPGSEINLGNQSPAFHNTKSNMPNGSYSTPPQFFNRPSLEHVNMPNGNAIPTRIQLPYNNRAHPVCYTNQPYLQNMQMANGSVIHQGMPQDQIHHYQRMPPPQLYSRGDTYYRDIQNMNPRLPNEKAVQYNNVGDRYR